MELSRDIFYEFLSQFLLLNHSSSFGVGKISRFLSAESHRAFATKTGSSRERPRRSGRWRYVVYVRPLSFNKNFMHFQAAECDQRRKGGQARRFFPTGLSG